LAQGKKYSPVLQFQYSFEVYMLSYKCLQILNSLCSNYFDKYFNHSVSFDKKAEDKARDAEALHRKTRGAAPPMQCKKASSTPQFSAPPLFTPNTDLASFVLLVRERH